MTIEEENLVKEHMLDVEMFNEYIADAGSHDFQEVVTEVFQNMTKYVDINTFRFPGIRQEIETFMTEYLNTL